MIRTIILRIGLSLITMPINSAGLNALPRELGSHGSAVNNTVRQLAGAIGTVVVMTIYSIKFAFHATTIDTQQDVHEKNFQLSSVLSTNGAYLVMLGFAIVGLIVVGFMSIVQKTQ